MLSADKWTWCTTHLINAFEDYNKFLIAVQIMCHIQIQLTALPSAVDTYWLRSPMYFTIVHSLSTSTIQSRQYATVAFSPARRLLPAVENTGSNMFRMCSAERCLLRAVNTSLHWSAWYRIMSHYCYWVSRRCFADNARPYLPAASYHPFEPPLSPFWAQLS